MITICHIELFSIDLALIQNIQIIPLCTWSNLICFSKHLLQQKLDNRCIESSIRQLNYAAASRGH